MHLKLNHETPKHISSHSINRNFCLIIFTLITCFTVKESLGDAGVVFVNPNFVASANPSTGTEQAPFRTLQQALQSDATTIVLYPGLYESSENTQSRIANKSVSLISYALYSDHPSPSDTSDPDQIPILKCDPETEDQETIPAFILSGEGEISLRGLTFQQCSTVIYFHSTNHNEVADFPVSIRDCVFTENLGDLIVLQYTSSLILERNQFSKNNGNIVYYTGGGTLSSISVKNSTVSFSGGFYLASVEMELDGLIFDHPVGRSLFLNPAKNSKNTIRRCEFRNSASQMIGSTLYIQGVDIATPSVQGRLSMEECLFEDNSAEKGAALWLGGMSASVGNSNFTNCNAKVGGALYLSSASVEVYGCVFENNHAEKEGGAIFLAQNSRATISDSIFLDNGAEESGNIVGCQSKDNSVVLPPEQKSTVLEGLSDSCGFSYVIETDWDMLWIVIGASIGSFVFVFALAIGVVAVVLIKKKGNQPRYSEFSSELPEEELSEITE